MKIIVNSFLPSYVFEVFPKRRRKLQKRKDNKETEKQSSTKERREASGHTKL